MLRGQASYGLLAVLYAAVGCATSEPYRDIVKSWVGADVRELVGAWGEPTEMFEKPDSKTVAVYDRRTAFTVPQRIHPSTGGQATSLWCRTEFEADQKGTVVGWRIEGNSCTAPPAVAPRRR
jgi:hypothetical protein